MIEEPDYHAAVFAKWRIADDGNPSITHYKKGEKVRHLNARIFRLEIEGLATRRRQQTAITESELSITVQENQGKAAVKRATQDAEQTRTLAKGESDRVRIIGEGDAAKVVALAGGEAERITKTGLATAETIEKQAAASGGAQFQLTRQVVGRLAEALKSSGVDIVQRVQINTGGGTFQALIGMLLS